MKKKKKDKRPGSNWRQVMKRRGKKGQRKEKNTYRVKY